MVLGCEFLPDSYRATYRFDGLSDPLCDWQPVKLFQNWLYLFILLGTCNDTSCGILNQLQFVQRLATNTNQGAVDLQQTTANR